MTTKDDPAAAPRARAPRGAAFPEREGKLAPLTHQTDTRCPVLEIELCTTLGARLTAILADLDRESYYHQRRALGRPVLDGAIRDLSRLIHQLADGPRAAFP